MKALVIGHNELSKGAYSTVLRQYEYDYYTDIANMISQLDNSIDIYIRKPAGGYTREMTPVVNSINKHKYDFVLELHFNNVADKKVNGALCLAHHGSAGGQKVATEFLEKLCDEYGLRNKGIIKIKDSNERGGFGICKTCCPYVLIEPFFGNNQEAEKFKNKERFAKFIVDFIREAD
ncbi:hypothetical protein IX317_000473 [Fusobacterium sp. DD29]|uniref:N-acetylmuramoyl-L-alanine amidase n=1 Tax=unclassified Fusobacterium TaxID=2648384 RepID=UPI001B8C9DE6|nr:MULTISPECIES: N-acetylmuramoyl-L-alanine amidase [unclassified Fusobacterium]MBR8700223.1 hypothetical protein [Fusobacterium sp. DD45]MBR8710326.1 hypothetical protein [Fusobacterium sp. DD28]MBR8748812.1 hypothetical protein [Fusobacterium sp. DD29]MBR8750945.1 hypothetical protein [Fusobacterium sp. DD26]MBR8761031.1 hypothetical protein [Fusobacterium sp. DD25]